MNNTNAIVGEFDLLWNAPSWAVPALLVAFALTLLCVHTYRQTHLSAANRWFAALLKCAAVLLIAICLIGPMRRGTRPRPKANLWPILIDNSQSMQIKDDGEADNRGQLFATLLDPESAWRVRLEQDFDVRLFAFDSSLQSITSTDSELTFDGTSSSLTNSLQTLASRFASQPVGGVMLFSDGNLTDEEMESWKSLGFPVFPIVSANTSINHDLRIDSYSVSQSEFEAAPVTIHARFSSVGSPSQEATAQLHNIRTGKLIEQQTLKFDTDKKHSEVKFRFRPEPEGVGFFRLRVSDGFPSDEATLRNNQRTIAIDRKRGPYRILYIAGRPNWEFKFLRRSLDQDAEIELVGLLRIANKEPKFSFRDSNISSANPLFRGVSDEEEELGQQYDEPVMIRLGVNDKDELSSGFPKTKEELFAYHGLILDDIESSFFTQDQLLMIREFVAARGGGLLMLGGTESFGRTVFASSPLGELSPVYAARSTQSHPEGKFRFSITREGMLQSWIRLRDNEASELERLKSLDPLTTFNPVGEIKPGAFAIASVQSDDLKEHPAVITQRFGQGRTAAIPLGDLWRWSMRRGQNPSSKLQSENSDDLGQLWRQISHWLVAEVPHRVEVQAEELSSVSKPTRLAVRVCDELYRPLDNASVDISVRPVEQIGENLTFSVNAVASDQAAGEYTSQVWNAADGAFEATINVTAEDGSVVGSRATGWVTDSSAAEFENAELNRHVLESIANDTGGELVDADQIGAFVSELPSRKVPVMETWTYPLWHRPWVMLLAILLLCGEWGLRRWRGLA